MDCSEEFYKECVENEVKSQSYDSEDKKKMMEILKRFHVEQSNFDICNDDLIDDIFDEQNVSFESIDSDDDDVVMFFNYKTYLICFGIVTHSNFMIFYHTIFY